MMRLSDETMVTVKCALYFFIALLTPVAAVYGECAKFHYWPDVPSVMHAILSGLLAGFVAIRAFLDGSNERLEQKRNGRVQP